jgi:CheY-like chemotaxis protein
MLTDVNKELSYSDDILDNQHFFNINDKKNIPDFTNISILIVEDVQSSYQFLFAALRPTKANIYWVKDGQSAVDYMKANNFVDAILMDLKLPIMTGYEATQIIKQEFPNVSIIAQTAYAMEGDREKCMRIGCDDYLSKPIGINNLYNALNSQLSEILV